MYTGLTDSTLVVAEKVKEYLDAKKTEWGVKDIFWGDQRKIPRNPAICIETGAKSRELQGAPRLTEVIMEVYLIVYHNALEAGTNDQRRKNDLLSEQIEAEINSHEDFDGIVIHAYCTGVEPGYRRIGERS